MTRPTHWPTPASFTQASRYPCQLRLRSAPAASPWPPAADVALAADATQAVIAAGHIKTTALSKCLMMLRSCRRCCCQCWNLEALPHVESGSCSAAESCMKLTGKACKALDASNALCIATALRAAAATRRSACNSSGAVGSAQHRNKQLLSTQPIRSACRHAEVDTSQAGALHTLHH